MDFKNMSDTAQELLSTAFKEHVEVISIQAKYLAASGQTTFMIMAQIDGLLQTGAGTSIGKAVNMIIELSKIKGI